MDITELDLNQFRKTGTDKDISEPETRWRELLAGLRYLGNTSWPKLQSGQSWGEWTKEDVLKYFASGIDALRSVYIPMLEKSDNTSYWQLYQQAKKYMKSKPPETETELKDWEMKRKEKLKTESEIQEGIFDPLLIDRANKLKGVGIVVLVSDYASWSGSTLFVENRLPNDFEWILKDNNLSDDKRLKLERISKKLFPELPPHFVSSLTGPNWRNLPVYDLCLVPKPEFKFREVDYQGFQDLLYESYESFEQVPRAASPEITKQGEISKEQDKILPGKFFLCMKPIRVTIEGQRQNITNLISALPQNSFNTGWLASKKYDGMAIEIHKLGDKVKIISEDGEVITDKLPRLVNEIKSLDPKDLVLLAEVEYWEGDKHLPREVTAGKVHSAQVDDSNLIANVFDILYYDKDIHKEPYSERAKVRSSIKFPQSTTGIPNLKYATNSVPDILVKSESELKAIYEKLRNTPASEGFVIKQADSPYHLDLNTRNAWFKLHESAIMDGIVIQQIPTKTKGVYNYRYGVDPGKFAISPDNTVEIKGNKYLEVGKTFSTDISLQPGDILTIEGETFNFIENQKSKIYALTVWAPRFIGKSESNQPDTVSQILTKAEQAGVLMKKSITPDGKTLYQLIESEVFETDYMTLTELLETYPEFEQEINARLFINQVIPESVQITEQEDKGFSQALKRAEDAAKKAPKYWAIFDIHYRGKSAHKDFRVKKDSYLEGWTIADLPAGEIKEEVDTMEKAKYYAENVPWKFSPDMKPTTHAVAVPKAKEPLVWLKFNNETLGKHAIVPPGSVGATRFESGVFYNFDEGLAIPTVKKPAFEEYFLDMDKFKGRFVIRLVPFGEKWETPPKGEVKGQWQTWFNLTEQTPYILTRRARMKKDYVPDPEQVTSSGLPPEWEKKIPAELRWWESEMTRNEKLKQMDKAYNYLIEQNELTGNKIEMKESELVMESIGSGILRFHYSRGPKVIRGMPSSWSHYDLVIDTGKGYLDEWNLERSPSTQPMGVNTFRKKCSEQTPQGKPNKDWLSFEGSVPPEGVPLKKVQILGEISWDGQKGKWRYRTDSIIKESKEGEYRFTKDDETWADSIGNLYNTNKSVGNPEKVLPAYYKIIDKFKINIIEDTPLFTRLDFSDGKLLKGLWTIKRGSEDEDIWTFAKSARPGEPKESLDTNSLDLPLKLEHHGREYVLSETVKGGLILK